MNASNDAVLVHLNRASTAHGMLRIPHAHGVTLTCFGGELWITEDRSSEDIVLTEGQSRTLTSPGLALVTALQNADVEITPRSTAFFRVGLLSPVVQNDILNRARALRRETASELLEGLGRWLHRIGEKLTHHGQVAHTGGH